MGIIIRQSLKHSVVTYVGVVIGALNILVIYNKYLSPEQLGIYASLTSIPYIFSGLASLGTPQIILKFFGHFSDERNNHNGLLFFSLICALLGYLSFLVFFYLSRGIFTEVYASTSPMLTSYLWAFPIITFFVIINSIFETYIKAHLKIVVPAIIREVFMKSANSLLALLFGFNFLTFNDLVKGIILIYALSSLFLILYTAFLKKLFLRPDFSVFRSPQFINMRRFALWTFIGGATGTILPHIEKIMLPAYDAGLEMTAIFSIALNIGLVIAVPRNAIASIAEPILADSLRRNDLQNVESIYAKSALNLLSVGLLLFIGIWVNIDAIFQLIPNTEIYSKGKMVVFMVGLYSVLDMGTGLNSEILRNSDYYRQDFLLFFIRLVLLIAANLVLIPILGYNGASLSMVISIAFYNLIKFLFIRKKFKIQPFRLNNLFIVLLAIAAVFMASIVQIGGSTMQDALLSIVIKSILTLAIYLGGIFFFNLNLDLKNLFLSFSNKPSK